MVTLTGELKRPDDAPYGPGTMTFEMYPPDIRDDGDESVIVGKVTTPIAGDGTFTVSLRATDDPELTENVTGAIVYRATRTVGRAANGWWISLPGPGPTDWGDVTPIARSNVAVLPVPGPSGAIAISDIDSILVVTQAEYDALPSPRPAGTLYLRTA